jgi:CBS domain containing-hemolysin-like protein
MDEPNSLITFLGVLSLIAINAFFVTAEFSIVAVRRSRISQLVRDGDIQAQTVQSLQRSIDRLLSTTQLGITLSSLALGWVGERTMAVLVVGLIKHLPFSPLIIDAIAHSLAVPIAFISLAYLQIVLGELCPKSVALIYPEQLARFFGPPSLVISQVFRPFIEILNVSTRWLLRLVGIEHSGQVRCSQVTSEELRLMIATEKESIGLQAEERKLLNNVFEFGEVVAEEIMIPRTSIEFLSLTTTVGELLETVATQGYSDYPVIGESLDDIKGIIDYKSLALPLAKGQLDQDSSIAPWVESIIFISGETSLKDLLPLMQRSHQRMTIILDEFGGTLGLVTLHDVIAEIIGDSEDDSPTAEIDTMQQLDENTFLVPAQMNLEEVNEKLELDLPLADDYYTLGGFLLDRWQKIPVRGEQLTYGDLDFTVTAAEDNRLYQILIRRSQPIAETTNSD